jgi:type II secretory pathway pseudopilin PulG
MTSCRMRRGQRIVGFSLTEVLIALPILAFVALAFVTSMIYASRVSRITTNQIVAKNIAQSYFERMAIDDYGDVTPANYPSVTMETSPPLYLDRIRGTRCTVNIEISGYGTAENGGSNSLTDNNATWRVNQWAGNTLLITGGRGRGHRTSIVSNTATTLNLADSLDPAPGAGSEFIINGGKTVRITTQWAYLGKTYAAGIESLVIDWGPRR